VKDVICKEWMAEIVESARAGGGVSPQLAAHLRQCPACEERFEAEQSLTVQLRLLRDETAGERSSSYRRARLLDEFDRLRPSPVRRRNQWMLPAAAAAAVVALAVGLSWRTPLPSHGTQASAASDIRTAGYDEAPDISPDDTDFVPVPYAPPLAAGEFVRVVRADLYAAALDRMGVSVPVTNGEFRADIVVGQDGLPRAVRLLGAENVSN
jgi:hypothetical protein